MARRIVPSGSTNLTCIGYSIGKVSRAVRSCVTNQQINSLVANSSICDAAFLYYMICNWTPKLRREANGSRTPIVNKTLLSQYKFHVPPLAVQRAIAEVLGALDDKIAANRSTCKLLVDLADAKFQQAVSGIEPGSQTFGDVAEVGGGGTPKTSVEEYWTGEIPWATPTDVTALEVPYLSSTGRTISEDGLSACSSSLYPAGSILMTSRATIGAFAIAEVPTAVNQGFIVVNSRMPQLQWWLFHEMRCRVREFISYANGATFMELPRGKFKKLGVRIPGHDSAQRFTSEVEPLHRLAATLKRETDVLARTRDELLPLLMSGKLRVKDAEQVVEEIA